MQDGVEWFGDTGPQVDIAIFRAAGPATVPDVTSLGHLDALRMVQDADLVAVFTGPVGIHTDVFSQNPAGGAMVPRGSVVHVQMANPTPRQLG